MIGGKTIRTLQSLRNWRPLTNDPKELNLERTLFSGQSFRWKKLLIASELEASQVESIPIGQSNNIYSCVLGDKNPVFVALRQISPDAGVEFSAFIECPMNDSELETMLSTYFQLDVSLVGLWAEWMKDRNFAQKAPYLDGLRVCRQPQVENIFSFICSSNNNIKRISGMVENMCRKYGSFICAFQPSTDSLPVNTDFYAFPTVKQLMDANDLDQELRELGFGYRSKFIKGTADYLHSQPDDYLPNLVTMSYHDCRTELLKLPGVGPKVADCISLFSMCKNGVIPVDTHVLQIATRDYNVTVKKLNAKSYLEIGDAFRATFGDYAGWAHSVLFFADLKPTSGSSNPKSSRKRKLE